MKASQLARLPSALPSLEHLLDDLGNPTPEMLGMALDVSPSTVRRWIREDSAPKPVLLSLFWISRGGMANVDADAHNQAIASARLAQSLQRRVEELERLLETAGRINAFGSANDPSPLTPVASGAPAEGQRNAVPLLQAA